MSHHYRIRRAVGFVARGFLWGLFALFGAHTTSSSSGATLGFALHCGTIEPIIRPVLTEEQVFEALFELPEAERAEVVARLRGEDVSARLTPEQEEELRESIREHRENLTL